MKHVIHIFGPSGAGTTTLGKYICGQLGYTLMDTDDYFWVPTDPKYILKREENERVELMRRDIQNAENVVISGSLVDWGDELIPFFTLAVRLEAAAEIRIPRLERRQRENFGDRIDEGGDMFTQHQDFMAWTKMYDTGGLSMRSRAKHDEWQKLLRCPLLELDGADSIESNFDRVRRALGV